ncbi:hypothetical protein B0T14DRAFT_508358 [Immersiella caudata]|uniref:Heterokaryon incompatibility domain-containing protein n=1 Tax=Immersiella caudata TaxID=314043 RepID=A0AA40CCT4_9PEZI|nr:hypothetical protein B0T14DRAFT_508358 [Immersiella caudata]
MPQARGSPPFAYTQKARADQICLLEPVYSASRRPQFKIGYFLRIEAPPYTAVSHTWSHGAKDGEVLLDDNSGWLKRKCDITKGPNGQSSYRLNSSTWTHIWVDSICINQDDTVEKTVQVGRMDRTYMEAESVSVWLGGIRCLSSWEEEIESLLKHRYWSRTWVIQEFLLGKNITLHCGQFYYPEDCIDLESFIDLAPDSSTNTAGTDTFSFAYSLLKAKMNRIEQQPLSVLMERHQHSMCDHPRDKVFSLLSLMPPLERGLIQRFLPDYKLPVEMVIILTLLHLVHCESQTLEQACEKVFLAFGIRDPKQQRPLSQVAATPWLGAWYLENTTRRDKMLYKFLWKRLRPRESFEEGQQRFPHCSYTNREREQDEAVAKDQKRQVQIYRWKENAKIGGIAAGGIAAVGWWFGLW